MGGVSAAADGVDILYPVVINMEYTSDFEGP